MAFGMLLLLLCLRTANPTAFVLTRRLGSGGHHRIRRTRLPVKLTSDEVRMRMRDRVKKLREKDRRSKVMKSTDLNVVFEDDYIVVVNKPSGVLSVPSGRGVPSLVQTVFETIDHSLSSHDRMVVHRLGMDTSGLILFAKTMDALRGMNALFRTRKVLRQYEVLVCGHMFGQEKEDKSDGNIPNDDDKDSESDSNDDEAENKQECVNRKVVKRGEEIIQDMAKEGQPAPFEGGVINLPLMRDYEFPPYMRISTKEHQLALLDFDSTIIGKKLLEAPKESKTAFRIVQREALGKAQLPVTRLVLTSITGRTHQLNVHCAAYGHPIVGDRVYGLDGDAAPNGGLDESDRQSPHAVDVDLQQKIADAAADDDMNMCVHATRLKFRHPITGEIKTFVSDPPF